MAKKNVLILSEKLDDADSIVDTYNEAGGYSPQLIYNVDDAIGKLISSDISLLVFNVKGFTMKKLQAVLDLRALGADFPILTLAKEVDEQAYKKVSFVDAAIILEKPYDDTQLLELSSKMINGDGAVSQRLYRRFATKEIAMLTLDGTTNSIKTEVKNLSKTGAKLCGPIDIEIEKNKQCHIEFLLKDNKTHTRNAKIVWLSQNKEMQLLFFGVLFI
jgi:DNA-binding response OmpR family regulator